MPFHIFVMRDAVACLIASFTIFSVGYIAGQNIHILLHYFVLYERAFIVGIIALIIFFLVVVYFQQKRNTLSDNDSDPKS